MEKDEFLRLLPKLIREDDEVTFELPDITIHPGSYALIRAKIDVDQADGTSVVHIRTSSGIYPNCYDYFGEGGFVEIVKNGSTVDFVRFGPSSVTPANAEQWLGGTAPALPSSAGRRLWP